MADEEETEVEEGGGKSGKKTLILVIVAVVVALLLGGGGVAAFFIFTQEPAATESADAEAAPAVEAIYTKIRTLEGRPMFVVSLDSVDGGAHYMQLYVEAKSRDAAVDDALNLHMPLIVARLNALFSSQNFDELISSIDAKRKMQADALEIVQSILTEKTGSAGVEQILFTNMVMQ